ncbi:MAG TPA: peptidylprolyl isomerase [Chitinophagaceae bacterium]|nr:peptidylprolyl isomerase [Chitinophagaceae bacterium]
MPSISLRYASLLTIAAFLTSLLSVFPASAQPQSADRIIAKIGKGRIILQSDLEREFEQFKVENESASDSMKCTLLQEMIFQKLLAEQADRDSVVISEEELEANMDQRVRYYVAQAGSQERLEQYLGKTIYQMKDETRDMVREQMVADRMKGQIFSNVKITPVEVKKYFDKIPADSLPFFPASVEIGQIVIEPPVSPELDNYARTKLEDIRKQIKDEGKSFETMAGIYSTDPGSRDQGGDLGWVERGQMVPEFEKAYLRLQVGEVSQLVKTEYGYHILQVVARKNDKVHVRHILIRPERSTADFKAAMIKLDSVRAELISGKITFQLAVGKYSTDKSSKMTGGMVSDPRTGSSKLQIKDLDPAMMLAIDSLKPGSFSQPQIYNNPQTGEKSCRVIYLKSRTEPHKANLVDDYNSIQEVALRQKQLDHQNAWLQEKLPSFYIKIDKEYQDCPELMPWIAALNKK